MLVCGSNYGTAYIRALHERPDTYQLAGLLARGSPRSRSVAQKFDVPLYATVADVPGTVDLACAAMGNAAFDVVLGLLGRGFHVLLEHPVRPRDRAGGRCRGKPRVRLHVQTLFASLAAPRDFIDACRMHALTKPRALIELLVTDRSLYASLDILRQAIGSLEPFTCDAPSSDSLGRFDTLNGTSRDVPTVVRVQRSRQADGRQLADGAPEYLVDCRISVWFDDGVLTLLSVAGPVVWNTAFRKTAAPDDPAWLTMRTTSSTFGDLMRQQTEANLDAIDALSAHAGGGTQPAVQCFEHQLEIARVWEHLGQRLGGRPRIRPVSRRIRAG